MEDEISHWLELPAGTRQVPFSKLARLIAVTIHESYDISGSDDEVEEKAFVGRFNAITAERRLETQLPHAVSSGRLRVLDSLTFEKYTLPSVYPLSETLVKVADLRAYLSELYIGVRLMPDERGMGLRAPQQSSEAEQAGAALTPSVPVPAVAAPGTSKRWTPEALEELRAYRAANGTTKAAKWADVSATRVRALLPRDPPKPKGYSPFNPR